MLAVSPRRICDQIEDADEGHVGTFDRGMSVSTLLARRQDPNSGWQPDSRRDPRCDGDRRQLLPRLTSRDNSDATETGAVHTILKFRANVRRTGSDPTSEYQFE